MSVFFGFKAFVEVMVVDSTSFSLPISRHWEAWNDLSILHV